MKPFSTSVFLLHMSLVLHHKVTLRLRIQDSAAIPPQGLALPSLPGPPTALWHVQFWIDKKLIPLQNYCNTKLFPGIANAEWIITHFAGSTWFFHVPCEKNIKEKHINLCTKFCFIGLHSCTYTGMKMTWMNNTFHTIKHASSKCL